MFFCKYCKIFKNSFFRENLSWLLLFLETMMYECLISWMKIVVCINLVVNSVLFWLGTVPGRLHWIWADFINYLGDINNLSRYQIFYLSLVYQKIINNYCTAHWHIRPKSDDEQGINKLWPNNNNRR